MPPQPSIATYIAEELNGDLSNLHMQPRGRLTIPAEAVNLRTLQIGGEFTSAAIQQPPSSPWGEMGFYLADYVPTMDTNATAITWLETAAPLVDPDDSQYPTTISIPPADIPAPDTEPQSIRVDRLPLTIPVDDRLASDMTAGVVAYIDNAFNVGYRAQASARMLRNFRERSNAVEHFISHTDGNLASTFITTIRNIQKRRNNVGLGGGTVSIATDFYNDLLDHTRNGNPVLNEEDGRAIRYGATWRPVLPLAEPTATDQLFAFLNNMQGNATNWIQQFEFRALDQLDAMSGHTRFLLTVYHALQIHNGYDVHLIKTSP